MSKVWSCHQDKQGASVGCSWVNRKHIFPWCRNIDIGEDNNWDNSTGAASAVVGATVERYSVCSWCNSIAGGLGLGSRYERKGIFGIKLHNRIPKRRSSVSLHRSIVWNLENRI